MRVLFCTPTFESITHGPAKFANLLPEINERCPGCEIRILTEGVRRDIPGLVYRVAIEIPRPLHALRNFFRMAAYFRKARHIFRQFPFDVIVFNNAIHGYWSAVRLPESIRVAGLINDEENLETGWSNFQFSGKWLIKYVHRIFEKAMVDRSDLILACSEYLRAKILEEYGITQKKVEVLYQGIKLSDIPFSGKRIIEETSPVRVLFVKADYQIGGLDVLAEALGKLKPRKFELRVAGPPAEKEKEIRRLVRGIANVELVFLGQQEQAEIFEQMQACDILCTPSRSEGLGVANIEGLAAGIPVVATRTGGVPEVLDQGRNGWLAEPGDVASLAGNIEACLADPETRWERSRNGRAFAENKFDHQKMLERFVGLISGALTGGGGRK